MGIEKTKGFRDSPPRDKDGKVMDRSWYHRRWLAYRRTPGYWFRRIYFGWKVWWLVAGLWFVASNLVFWGLIHRRGRVVTLLVVLWLVVWSQRDRFIVLVSEGLP